MTLYLYKTETRAPILTIENVVSHTDSEVRTAEGAVYGPLAEDCELSSLPDCSETLRADWRERNPTTKAQVAEIRESLAALSTAIEKGLSL